MRRRRGIAVLSAAIVAAAALLTACGAGSGSKKTIAFLLSGPDLYYQYGLDGAKATAKKLGYTVKVYPNPNSSPSVELANVEDAVAAHVTAIDGYSVGLSTETATIAKASSANIPVFLMYGYSPTYLHQKDVIGFEQVPLVPYGVPIGSYLRQHLAPGGQVAVITGQLGRGDAEGYRTGFLQGLGCSGNTTAGAPTLTCANGITYVAQETGKWLRPAAYSATQNLIGKYPKLAGMFVENDDMAVGAHTALVAAHKDKQVTIVSQNGAPYGLAGIRAGWLAGSDTVSPSLEGLYSVRLIDAYLRHKVAGGKLYYSYEKFVSKQNVDQAVGWAFFQDPSQMAKWMNAPLLKPVANPPSSP